MIISQEYYLGNKDRRGKIAEKLYALTKKFKSKGLIDKSTKTKRPAKNSNSKGTPRTITNVEPTDDETANYLWLKNNISPESIVVEKWGLTFSMRRNDVLDGKIDLFSKWPLLTKKIGITLVRFFLFLIFLTGFNKRLTRHKENSD